MSQYKIGQLAKLMGVSTHLLKHYEKFGLVVPTIDESTNYRYYNICQCSRIIESKKYRNLGFSLNDTAELVNHAGNEEVNDKVKEQIIYLETQIKELELQKKMAETFLNNSKVLDQKLNQWFIEFSPSYIFLKQTEELSIMEEGQCITSEGNYIDEIPLANSAIYIYGDSMKQDEMLYHWGIVKQVEMQEESVGNECYIKMNACRCFTTYLAIDKPYIENNQLIKQIKQQYYQFREDELHDILAIRYKIVHEGNNEIHYFKVLAPIT